MKLCDDTISLDDVLNESYLKTRIHIVAASAESTAPMACPICGKSESLRRCGSCKRVNYCSREHQRQHWKAHRAECTYQSKQDDQPRLQFASPSHEIHPTASGLQPSGRDEGAYEDAVPTRTNGLYQRCSLCGSCQNAFPPFTEEFNRRFGLGFGVDELNDMLNCRGIGGELNVMAIYIGSELDNGISMSVNASGDAFFIGTTAKGKPVTSNVLWGAANFVCEAMDYYPMTIARRSNASRSSANGVADMYSERGSPWQGMPALIVPDGSLPVCCALADRGPPRTVSCSCKRLDEEGMTT
ncbi:Zinc finger, MYND-type [Phytophthora cactorum]|nr:Zinc finger, MYND-type [Phytophthora cactorum]